MTKIAEKRIEAKAEANRIGDENYALKVERCFSGIELQHFCKNEKFTSKFSGIIPLGFGLFWEVIVPKVLEITQGVGCKYLYLFAADNTENPSTRKLVQYYKNSLKFYDCQDDDIIIIKPEYDNGCYGLVEEISVIKDNYMDIWEEYSDVISNI